MKIVVNIDPKTLKIDSSRYDEPGLLPPIIKPDNPDETKDGGVPDEKKNPEDPEQG